MNSHFFQKKSSSQNSHFDTSLCGKITTDSCHLTDRTPHTPSFRKTHLKSLTTDRTPVINAQIASEQLKGQRLKRVSNAHERMSELRNYPGDQIKRPDDIKLFFAVTMNATAAMSGQSNGNGNGTNMCAKLYMYVTCGNNNSNTCTRINV